MGRLVSNTSMTVDGLGDGAWFVAEGDHDTAGVDQLAAAAGFETGRKCYEGFPGYWPSATGPWAEVLNPILALGALHKSGLSERVSGRRGRRHSCALNRCLRLTEHGGAPRLTLARRRQVPVPEWLHE
jgi:hypothetical protein